MVPPTPPGELPGQPHLHSGPSPPLIPFVPGDQLDKVIVESDASTCIKDGGVGVTIEVTGDNLEEGKDCYHSRPISKAAADSDPQAAHSRRGLSS